MSADPILDAITGASDLAALQTIHNAHAGDWRDVHTDAAEQRWQVTQRAADVLHGFAVDLEARRLRVRADARALVEHGDADTITLPPLTNLAEFLAQPDPPVRYRVTDLWPAAGRVLLAAQFKTGKSTLAGNLVKSLADGTPFLGRFDVEQAGRVVLVDDELDDGTARRWLRDHNLANPERVDLVTLRGRVGTFDIVNAATRARWATLIGPADVLIFDCLRPALDALGLSEDKDAGRFLVAFDALLTEAGIGEALLVHHAGHGGERARGDSRLRDWPDAEWRLVRDGDEPHAPRYFTAFGRDVDVREQRLAFEPLDRSLRLEGGSRRDVKVDAAGADILALLADQEHGLSGRDVEHAMTGQHPQRSVRSALHRLVESGDVLTENGPRRATLHFINPASASVRRSAPQCVNAVDSSASVRLKGRTALDEPEDPSSASFDAA